MTNQWCNPAINAYVDIHTNVIYLLCHKKVVCNKKEGSAVILVAVIFVSLDIKKFLTQCLIKKEEKHFLLKADVPNSSENSNKVSKNKRLFIQCFNV